MGCADSPDIANLWGYYFEIAQGQTCGHDWLLYYKRYIDDIFCIVSAESEQEALRKARETFSFVGCRITWDAFASACPFLDVLVFKDPRDPHALHFKPYRKAQNHRERLPYISHHPHDVKRGTFLGEMSRLASLCSHREYYNDALYDLQGLYRARGYPAGLLSQWTKEHISDKWDNRYLSHKKDDGEHDTFVVLKSEFNPVLNYFQAKELGDTIVSSWRSSMETWTAGVKPLIYDQKRFDLGKEYLLSDVKLSEGLPDSVMTPRGGDAELGRRKRLPDVTKLNSLMRARWLVSRKRTKNLFDLTNLWKRIVLTSMDQNLFDDLNAYRPVEDIRYGSPEPVPDVGWEIEHHSTTETSLGKRPALDSEVIAEESRSRTRPRLGFSEMTARTTSSWGRKGVSDVAVGSSAPKGLITHYLKKSDTSKSKRK